MLNDERKPPGRPAARGAAARRIDVAAGTLAGCGRGAALADRNRSVGAPYMRCAMLQWPEAIAIGVVLLIFACLAFVYLDRQSRPSPLALRAVCGSNLRGTGQALALYTAENSGAYPEHYFERDANAAAIGAGRHGIDWIGAMGSHDWLKISQQTSAALSPKRSHPSRSYFLLISNADMLLCQTLCPGNDTEDDMKNHGPDADAPGAASMAQPGVNRFDLRGYSSLSYGHRFPFSKRAPAEKRDAREVVAADKGPYFDAGPPGLAGTQTTTDAPRDVAFPAAWGGMTADQLRKLDNKTWSRFNSRNHKGEGQNVLLLDGHVDFCRRPTAGINDDNIYTFSRTPDDPASLLLGVRPQDAPLFGPTGQSDSYIVP